MRYQWKYLQCILSYVIQFFSKFTKFYFAFYASIVYNGYPKNNSQIQKINEIKMESTRKIRFDAFYLRDQGIYSQQFFKISYEFRQQMALRYCFIILEFHYLEHSFVGTIGLQILSSNCTTLFLQTVGVLKMLFYIIFFQSTTSFVHEICN